jgi:hypothetical protein
MAVRLPILIGIHGVQQAGKDTAYGFIQEWAKITGYSVAKRGFADEMKLAIARLYFGDQPWLTREVAVAWCDKYKLDPTAVTTMEHTITSGEGEAVVPALLDRTDVDHEYPHATMRDLMRRMGTEVGRMMWGIDFWVDKLVYPPHIGIIRTSEEQFDGAEICVVTDVRFQNEINRIQRNYGQTWVIRRKAAEDKVIADAYKAGKQLHVSDLLLDDKFFNYNFNNHTTVEELRQEVFAVMDDIHRRATK